MSFRPFSAAHDTAVIRDRRSRSPNRPRSREPPPMHSAFRALILCLSLVAVAPAGAEVRVVPPFDPASYADRAAVGLLVPGAGPEVTREGALAALLRGKVEHDLLGGEPGG